MKNQIWLPDSETRVTVKDGEVKVWEQMKMIKENINSNKSTFGFKKEKKDEE